MQDDGFDDQIVKNVFLGLAEKDGEQLGCGFAFSRPDASVCANISCRLSSNSGCIRSTTKRRFSFINSAGTAATMVFRTRLPVAFASACSFRLLSCSALKLALALVDCF